MKSHPDERVRGSHRLILSPWDHEAYLSIRPASAATSARDTDFTAKLVDVESDGYCANLAQGVIRCRYRNHMAKAEFLDPGEVKLFIELWDVAHVFGAGHRIRPEITKPPSRYSTTPSGPPG